MASDANYDDEPILKAFSCDSFAQDEVAYDLARVFWEAAHVVLATVRRSDERSATLCKLLDARETALHAYTCKPRRVRVPQLADDPEQPLDARGYIT